MFDRNRWLARLSFSFFVVALLLAWEGYKIFRTPGEPVTWRGALCLAGAALAALLGAAGVRARHRGNDR